MCLAYHNTVVVLMAQFSQRRVRDKWRWWWWWWWWIQLCIPLHIERPNTSLFVFLVINKHKFLYAHSEPNKNLLVQIGDNHSKMKYKNLFCKNSKQSGFLNADFLLYWSSSTDFSVSWLEVITFFQFSSRFLEGSRRTSVSI